MTNQQTSTNGAQVSVHVVLRGKGGVGKSLVSAILAEYFRGNFRAGALPVQRSSRWDVRWWRGTLCVWLTGVPPPGLDAVVCRSSSGRRPAVLARL